MNVCTNIPLRQLPIDTRRALGTTHGDADCCWFDCWPTLITATHNTENGDPCCSRCAANPDRKRRMPIWRTA